MLPSPNSIPKRYRHACVNEVRKEADDSKTKSKKFKKFKKFVLLDNPLYCVTLIIFASQICGVLHQHISSHFTSANLTIRILILFPSLQLLLPNTRIDIHIPMPDSRGCKHHLMRMKRCAGQCFRATGVEEGGGVGLEGVEEGTIDIEQGERMGV